MKQQKFAEQFSTIYSLAVRLVKSVQADAILVLLEGPTDWQLLKKHAQGIQVLVAADTDEQLEGTSEFGLSTVQLNMPESPVHDKLTQALLESVAQDTLSSGASVVAVYSGFEAGQVDSLSFIELDERLGRLTARDLRQLSTNVPLDTLKMVVDLAIEIGREGREGKPVGTMFVVGDTRKVMSHSHPAGFDAVKGYRREERNLRDSRVREGVKEVAQLDGAFVVSADGTIDASCRVLVVGDESITLSKGLGSRHWAAAAITKATKAVAVVVSESNGTVRLFQNGEVVLRVEPFRRAMKWKDFDYEPPASFPPE